MNPESYRVRETATSQRLVLMTLLVLIVSYVFVLVSEPGGNGRIYLCVFQLLCVVPFVMYAVHRLATTLGSPSGAAVLYCVLMLIPVVNMIILLVLNQNAMNLLKQAGLRVGFFGVSDGELNRRGF